LIGASQIGPIRPIEYVKPGYHAWRYLSPRTDLGFRFVLKDHNHIDKEKNGEEQRRTYTLIFRPLGWKEDFLLKDLLWAAPPEAVCDDLQLDLDPIPHCTPSPSTSLNPTKLYKILSRTDTLLIPSYGEKVKPELAERLISEHPDVRGVLAFGEGEVGIGVVAELRGRGVVGGSHPHLNKKGEAGELEDGIPNTSRAHRVHVRGAQAAGEDG
jgi:acyl-CoA synthetase (AMP-forming)/AMP-acid ligase II